jgi:hypothetical protein
MIARKGGERCCAEELLKRSVPYAGISRIRFKGSFAGSETLSP